MFSIIKLMNRAEVNSSWWSGAGLKVDVGQYQCDALKLWSCSFLRCQFHRAFLLTVSSVGADLHQCAGEASPVFAVCRCQLWAIQRTSVQLPPTTSTDFTWFMKMTADITLEMEIVCIVIVEKNSKNCCWAVWVLSIYGAWRSWGRLIRLCHHILLGKSDGKRRLPATQAEGESERFLGCN